MQITSCEVTNTKYTQIYLTEEELQKQETKEIIKKYKEDQPVSATPKAQPKAAPDHGVWKEARPPLCKLWKSVNFTKTDQSIYNTISHLNK